jgi:hypothetical protein
MIHHATHSSARPAPREVEKPALAFAVAFLLSSFAEGGGSASAVALFSLPVPLLFVVLQEHHMAQSNFQSTANPLTSTIKLTQTPTVRRKPDCTI